jgi:TonB family protein
LTQPGAEIPAKIGRYEIVAPIGYGAMGAVYKAFDPIIKRSVAVKTLRLDVPPSSPDYRAFLERFAVEAKTAGRLSHPNIVTLYDVSSVDEPLPWLAMEFVDGRTVTEILQGERLKPELVVSLVSQIASAIDYAHSEGVIHRDIKPSNVIVHAGEKVKVTDFGIAKMMDAEATNSGLMMGTPSYMSPEQAMGEELDGRTDIFSLGVVAFEMLSGHQPFPGNNVTSILYKLVHSDPIHPDNLEVLGLLPDKWVEVFSRVLAKSPSERYPTASAFVQHLELCLGSWFGALEGETLVLHQPARKAFAVDPDETVVAPPPVTSLRPPPGLETVLSPPPNTAEFLERATAPFEAGDLDRPSAGSRVQDLGETVVDAGPDDERTLYAGPPPLPAPAPASLAEETVLETSPPPKAPVVSVTIRKPRSLKRLLVPSAAALLVLAGFAAYWMSRPSIEEPPPEMLEPPPAPPLVGSLRIATRPEGARVLVNGEERGTSPLLLSDLPLGTYRVRIEHTGFDVEELDAPITPEAPSAALELDLKPQPPVTAPPAAARSAVFRVRSEPPGALVAIDGREVGVTPIERIPVSPGSRVVRIVSDGFLPWEDTFRARPGRTETIDAILTARVHGLAEPAPPEPEPEPEPPRIVQGTLVERGEPGVVNPKCVRCPGAPFPAAALRNRLDREVLVEASFLIDENGDAGDIQILRSGGQVFDDSVIETVKSWRYEPATKHGVRVKMRWVQRFRFQQGR